MVAVDNLSVAVTCSLLCVRWPICTEMPYVKHRTHGRVNTFQIFMLWDSQNTESHHRSGVESVASLSIPLFSILVELLLNYFELVLCSRYKLGWKLLFLYFF